MCFFFQAEDGIRDVAVTGVQTCALPISGIVMCCTFGDTTDIKWWREHNLPLISVIDPAGRINDAGSFLANMDVKAARKKILEELTANNLVLDKKVTPQTVSMHER